MPARVAQQEEQKQAAKRDESSTANSCSGVCEQYPDRMMSQYHCQKGYFRTGGQMYGSGMSLSRPSNFFYLIGGDVPKTSPTTGQLPLVNHRGQITSIVSQRTDNGQRLQTQGVQPITAVAVRHAVHFCFLRGRDTSNGEKISERNNWGWGVFGCIAPVFTLLPSGSTGIVQSPLSGKSWGKCTFWEH